MFLVLLAEPPGRTILKVTVLSLLEYTGRTLNYGLHACACEDRDDHLLPRVSRVRKIIPLCIDWSKY